MNRSFRLLQARLAQRLADGRMGAGAEMAALAQGVADQVSARDTDMPSG